MTYSFHPKAESELIQAIDYYEDIEKGLGYEFTFEIYSTVERVLAHPIAWPVLDDNIRRALVRRFPYGIIYS